MNHRECQTCLQKAVLIVGEYLIKKTCEKVVFYNAFKCYSDRHFKKKFFNCESPESWTWGGY